jgi:hypothetical protein
MKQLNQYHHNQIYLYHHHKAAAKPYLALPTPVTSAATTPLFETKLVNETRLPVEP